MAVAESRPTATAPARPTLVLDDLYVTYKVYEDRRPKLKDLVANGFKRPASRSIPAVRGVSLTAHEGEVIGVIGGNGAGKSTLFRAMAGLIPPTAGHVYASSQPSLLGVGAALQPSVSGRRNIELGGLALGLSREEIDAKMDDIIAFTGLKNHIDLPLRTYSTGMKARLHFAIATSIDPELLLIDEALSVGDTVFKRRSRKRIEEMRKNAGTVFVVSHSLRSIERLCSRVIWFEQGRIVLDAPTAEVLDAYRAAEDDDD
jgi:teichoic acid transport system ATP-binding protein